MLEAGDVVVGVVLLALVAGGCGVTAWAAVRGWLAGAPAVLAAMTAFTAALVAVHLLPGVLGLLVPAAPAVLAVALGAAAWRWMPRASGSAAGDDGGTPLWAWLPALLLGGCALMFLREVAGAPITSIDAQNFQVPIPARWIQRESIWGLHQFIADYSNATYPQNGNLLLAAVMLPFDSPFLARLVAAPYWALAGVGVYAIAREVGAPRAAAPLAGAAFVAIPVMVRAGLEGAQTDAPALACLAAGVLFLLRHHRTGDTRELVVAGVALGLAFGTKWYAVPGVAALLAVWLVARRRERPTRDLAIVVSLVAAAGGFWMLRNLIETSNPMFPQPLGPFPAPPDPLREQGGFTLLHYATDFDVWKTYLHPAFAATFGNTGLMLLGGGLLAGLMRPRGPARAIAIGTLLLALLYLVTPYSAFGPEGRPVLAAASTRYGLPALMGLAVLTAWLGVRAVPLLAIAAVLGVADAFELGIGEMVVGALGVALLAAIPRRALLPIAAATALLVVPVSANRANDQGYGQFDPTLAWIEEHAPSGQRIGLAGVWSNDGVSPVLPAFGPRLQNDVEYVGEFREHMLREYRLETEFARALQRFDLLVVAAGSRKGAWAGFAGWDQVAHSDRLVLLRRSKVAGG